MESIVVGLSIIAKTKVLLSRAWKLHMRPSESQESFAMTGSGLQETMW